MKRLVRRTISVLGIILIILSVLVMPDDLMTGLLMAFCGVLSAAVGLGFLGE